MFEAIYHAQAMISQKQNLNPIDFFNQSYREYLDVFQFNVLKINEDLFF